MARRQRRERSFGVLSHRAGCVAFVLIAGTAGCTGGHDDDGAHHGAAAVTRSPVSASYAARQRARDQQAMAFARRLATQVPRLRGEKPLAAAPSGLGQPGDTIGVSDLITEARYWVVHRTPLQVYQAMKTSRSAPHQLTGFGRPGAADDPPNRAFLTYGDPPLPPYIQGGEISVTIVGRGSHRTVIASFAEVYTHPVRAAVERIEAAGSTGSYTWPRIELGKVVAHVPGPLGAGVLHQLVRNVNSSPVANSPDACLGGIQLPGNAVTIRISSTDHTWKLVYPGTSCIDLAVSRDGQELAALNPNRRLRRVLQVLEHVGASVRGQLLAVGGPPGAAASPERGEVTLSVGRRVVQRARTYGPGRFVLLPQAGRYTLSGSSPSYRINGRPGRCVAEHPVTVRTKHPVTLNVYCERK